MTNFDSAFAYLIGDEGNRFTDNPDDSGGPTNWGITQKSYSSFLGYLVSDDEMKRITIDAAKNFYLVRFWKPLMCDSLIDCGIAIALFDSSVLYGIGTATILAQQSASVQFKTIVVDGLMGEQTVQFLNQMQRASFLEYFTEFIMQRIDTIIRIAPKNEVFRDGWVKRCQRLLTLNTETTFNI
jgi:lysozyme family protein